SAAVGSTTARAVHPGHDVVGSTENTATPSTPSAITFTTVRTNHPTAPRAGYAIAARPPIDSSHRRVLVSKNARAGSISVSVTERTNDGAVTTTTSNAATVARIDHDRRTATSVPTSIRSGHTT